MDAWIKPEDLRGFVGNDKAGDATLLQRACDVACGMVTDRCGPVSPARTCTDTRVMSILTFRPTELVTITTYNGGEVLPVGDYDFDRQLLVRRDGTPIVDPLTVTYTAGHDPADIPAPLVSAALHIAQQYLTTVRVLGRNTEAPRGFLVPNTAAEEMSPYLLWTGGFA